MTMRAFRWATGLMVVAAVWSQAPAGGQGGGSKDEIKLKVVKYDELAELVRVNKGKVILLDFWATTCIPCKLSFPYTVELHKQFGGKDLVVISVATDPLTNVFMLDDFKDPQPRIRKFLEEQKATFTNVALDEPASVLEEKLRIKTIPCLYVFNREGQWAQFIGDKLKVDEKHRPYQVEEYIKQLLAQPAKTASK
jgi:thiol-disulfide isomerase/thioredoxin